MMNKVIDDLQKLEVTLGIINENINRISIWGFVKDDIRGRYVLKRTGISPLYNNPRLIVLSQIKSSLKSFFKLLYCIITLKKYPILYLGFPRLELFENKYMDKFCDPIIMSMDTRHEYVYFERGRSGRHLYPRSIGNDRIVYTEFIDNFSSILGYIIWPLILSLNLRTFKSFAQKINRIVTIQVKDLIGIYIRVSKGLVKTYLLAFIFKMLGVKCVLAPALIKQYPYIVAANRCGIKSLEIQHGITMGKTVTYSGEYRPDIYPDMFLTFGRSSMKDGLFGVPISSMQNIGCAFKSLLNNRAQKKPNSYLLLSEPEITEQMITTTIELASLFPNYIFHLRPHPMEYFTIEQEELLASHENIKIDRSGKNSTLTCLEYEGVLAENTTVLYEAISVGVKAARLQYNGLKPIHFQDEPDGVFYYMKCPEDFKTFAEEYVLNDFNKEIYYSTFNSDLLVSILEL